MTFPLTRSCLILAVAALAAPVRAEDAGAVLKRAAQAMGVDRVKTIRYAGRGSAASFGQAFRPGMAWPKMNYTNYSRVIDYGNAAWREEFGRSRSEPTGGGAAPLVGEQKVVQALSGNYAWNVVGTAAVPALVAIAPRQHELWTSPQGVVMAALKRGGEVEFRTERGREIAAVSFTEPGLFAATVFLTPDYLVERVESRSASPVLGDFTTVTRYSGYRDFGGVPFPTRIEQSQAGSSVLDLTVLDVEPNAAADIAVPDNVRAAAERAAVEKAADGVWFIAGGSHNSVAVEMKDHIVLIESPLYDGRALPVLAAADALIPGKKVRYVVNSHSHFDHAGGLRAAVAAGATLIVQQQNKPYYEKAFANPNRISPDALAKSGKKPKITGVGEKLVLRDSTRTIELYHQKSSVHSDTFLIAWLPKERILVEADAYTPLPPNAPPPSPLNGNNLNLADNIARLNLPVERILPLHGRMVPVAEFSRTIGK